MEEALNRLRAHVPELPPVGAVIERDGPVVRTHYGTHGEVAHGPLTGDLDALVARQAEAFTRRNEPAVWPVYGYDSDRLPEVLRAAGFVPEPARAVLVCPIGTDRTEWRGVRDWAEDERIAALAEAAGPHRLPYPEFVADGSNLDGDGEVLIDEAGHAAWAQIIGEFAVLGGATDPGFAAELAHFGWRRPGRPAWRRHPDVRHFLAEATGELRTALEAAGMRAITTVTRYRLPARGEPARTRPVRLLFKDPEYDELWTNFEERFGFRPSLSVFPGIDEPAGSATWHIGGHFGAAADLDRIVHKGLRASVAPGEELYWLDWQHVGYRFDPARVDGAGPRWPGAVFPDGDYYIHLTRDLRLGTFGHPSEATLCVFGEPLLTLAGPELTALLGPPNRTSEA